MVPSKNPDSRDDRQEEDIFTYEDGSVHVAVWIADSTMTGWIQADSFVRLSTITVSAKPMDAWWLDVAPNSATNNTSPWQLGVQWLTGTGPRQQNFKDGDPMTVLLQEHSHIEDTRKLIAANIANGGDLKGSNNYGLGGLAGVPKYLKDYSTLATGGLTGNLAVTYLGSYRLDYEVTDINLENGTATVQFHVTNDSTINSATHPPMIGYTQTWNTYIGQPLNNFFSTGPLSKTSQDFQWTETIKWP